MKKVQDTPSSIPAKRPLSQEPDGKEHSQSKKARLVDRVSSDSGFEDDSNFMTLTPSSSSRCIHSDFTGSSGPMSLPNVLPTSSSREYRSPEPNVDKLETLAASSVLSTRKSIPVPLLAHTTPTSPTADTPKHIRNTPHTTPHAERALPGPSTSRIYPAALHPSRISRERLEHWKTKTALENIARANVTRPSAPLPLALREEYNQPLLFFECRPEEPKASTADEEHAPVRRRPGARARAESQPTPRRVRRSGDDFSPRPLYKTR